MFIIFLYSFKYFVKYLSCFPLIGFHSCQFYHPFGATRTPVPNTRRNQGLQKSGPMGFAMIGNAKVQPEGLGEIIENLTLAGPTWMSQTVSKWLVNRLQSQYVPFLNRLRSQSYNPVANHLLNSWDIQAPQETSRNKDLQCFVFWEGNLVFFSTKNNLCAGYVFAIRQAIWCIWCPWDVNIKYR